MPLAYGGPPVRAVNVAQAIVLIGHGSPDPDWAAPVEEVARTIQANQPACPVATAYLSGGQASLDQALTQVTQRGAREVTILACLLSAGGRHVKQDLPQLVAAAKHRWPDIAITLQPGALGSEPVVLAALASAALASVRAT